MSIGLHTYRLEYRHQSWLDVVFLCLAANYLVTIAGSIGLSLFRGMSWKPATRCELKGLWSIRKTLFHDSWRIDHLRAISDP
jgi:hypothetical protein